MTGSRASPSCPRCADPRALGGGLVAEEFLPWPSIPVHVVIPVGKEWGLQSRFAPNRASTKPSLTASFFVSAARQLAPPPPGGGTALGVVQAPEPGGWWQPGCRRDSGTLLDSGSGSWAVGRCRPQGRWPRQGPESGHFSAWQTPQATACAIRSFLQPRGGLQPPASLRDSGGHSRSWSGALRAWQGPRWLCAMSHWFSQSRGRWDLLLHNENQINRGTGSQPHHCHAVPCVIVPFGLRSHYNGNVCVGFCLMCALRLKLRCLHSCLAGCDAKCCNPGAARSAQT